MRLLTAVLLSAMLLLQPVIASGSSTDSSGDYLSDEAAHENWWENTNMDKNRDGIQDNIWTAIDSKKHN